MLDTNHLIYLGVVVAALAGGIMAATLIPFARDVFFFGMVAGLAFTDRLSVTFLSYYWYRGSTRGFEVSLVDILAVSVLVGTMLWPRHGERRFYWPAGFGWMLVFFAYAIASVVISNPKIYGVFELSKMVRGFIFFLAAAYYVRSPRELKILVLALSLVMCLEGALAIKQRVIGGMDRVPGTLEHENSLSMYVCLVAPIFVAAASTSMPWILRFLSITAIGAAAVAIMLTVSRAGIPIFAAVMLGATAFCVSWRITPKKMVITGLVALAVAGLFLKTWDNLKERYAEASFEDEYLDAHQEGRGYYLRLAKVITNDRFRGVGLNNWSYWVSKKYGALVGRPYDDYDSLHSTEMDDKTVEKYIWAAPAHNLEALTIGELGVPGLTLFILLWCRWFQIGGRFLFSRSPQEVWSARAEQLAALTVCKQGIWGLFILAMAWAKWAVRMVRALFNRNDDSIMHRLGVGLFFGVCGVFLQSLTEWVFRQSHIYLTFNIFMGTLASLCYARRKARKQVPVPFQVPRPEPEYAYQAPMPVPVEA